MAGALQPEYCSSGKFIFFIPTKKNTAVVVRAWTTPEKDKTQYQIA